MTVDPFELPDEESIIGEAETFTGTPLEQMTLTQQLLEVAEDELRRRGLSRSFWENWKDVDFDYALKRHRQKKRIRKSGHTLDEALAEYDDQIAEARALIKQNPKAYKHDGLVYRPVNQHIADVERVLDFLNSRNDKKSTKDARRFVKEQRERIAREKRRLGLDEKHPNRSWGRAWGKTKNFFIDYRKIIAPTAALLVAGSIAYGITNHYVDKHNRNRPQNIVDNALVTNDHPGVQAALTVNNAAMVANKAHNLYLSGDAGNDSQDIILRHDSMLGRVNRAQESLTKTGTYFRQMDNAVGNWMKTGSIIVGAWSHHESKTERTYECNCTDVDTDGDGTADDQDCDTCTECVYIDHVWEYDSAQARNFVKTGKKGKKELEKILGTNGNTRTVHMINVNKIESEIRDRIKDAPGFKEMTQAQQKRFIDQNLDWLSSISIVDNNTTIARLEALASNHGIGNNFNYLARSVALGTIPTRTEDRDRSCGSGDAPYEYTLSMSYGNAMEQLGKTHARTRKVIVGTSEKLLEYKKALLAVNTMLENGMDPDKLDQFYEDMHEVPVAWQKQFNPGSDYKVMNKFWRKWTAPLVGFGIGTLTAIGAFFLVGGIRRNRYLNRMHNRNIYS